MIHHDAEDYRGALLQLLPPGPAWSRDPTAPLGLLLHALSEELARVEERLHDLVDESDPRTTSELLDDWERAWGLPDPCGATPTTEAERQAALTARVISTGGQNPAYIIEVAAALGYTATIVEYDPFIAGDESVSSKTGDKVYSFGYDFTFTVDVSAEAADAVSHALFECMINRIKPAHTLALFDYPP